MKTKLKIKFHLHANFSPLRERILWNNHNNPSIYSMRQFSTSRSKNTSVVFRSADHDEQQTVTGDKFKNTVRKNPFFLQNIGVCIGLQCKY